MIRSSIWEAVVIIHPRNYRLVQDATEAIGNAP
jgi:hypothetical protein